MDALADFLVAEKRLPARVKWVEGWGKIAEARRAAAAANAYF